MPDHEKVAAMALMAMVALGSAIGTFNVILHLVAIILRILGIM